MSGGPGLYGAAFSQNLEDSTFGGAGEDFGSSFKHGWKELSPWRGMKNIEQGTGSDREFICGLFSYKRSL